MYTQKKVLGGFDFYAFLKNENHGNNLNPEFEGTDYIPDREGRSSTDIAFPGEPAEE